MIALPAISIRKLQMSITSKISVAGVFAIAIVDTILGTIRLAALLYNALRIGHVDSILTGTYLTLSILEPGLAVIVCTLPVYKLLLPPFRRRRRMDRPVVLQYETARMGNAASYAKIGDLPTEQISSTEDLIASKV